MNDLKKTLIEKAMRQYQRIMPCGFKADLNECFTLENNRVFFWFNTEDQTTHVMTSEAL